MTHEPPNEYSAPYGQQQPSPQYYAHGAPPPAPRRKIGTGLIIGIVAGVVVLACCGITGIAAILGDDSQPEAQPSVTAPAIAAPASPSAPPTVAAAPTAPVSAAPDPVTAAPTTPAPQPSVAKTVTMPNLKGLNAAVADDKLRKIGFTNIQYGSQDENDTLVIMLANWTVTKQSAKAGAKLSPDDLVVVTCTKQG